MNAALVILDGWGLSDHDPAGADCSPGGPREHRDAVATADTPNVDAYREAGSFGTLRTHGRGVGLPEGQMGNSEVGHLTIGTGRVVYQEYARIEDAIADGELDAVPAIDGAFEHAARTGGRLHLLGLISDGGVHADHEHVHALVRAAADREVPAVVHAFTDGRDTSPTGAERFLAELEAVAAEAGTGDVATVSGRYYAMDRDRNWGRTRRAYDAIVNRETDHVAPTGVDAVAASYDRGDTDEFVEPTLVEGGHALQDGDAAVFCNFRADRARQLTRLLGDVEPEWNFETHPPDVHLVTMSEYDETFEFPVAFPPTEPEDTLGRALAAAGKTQLRIAESEKYAHVTYFLNGGRELEFPGEIREIVESPDVPTYDLQPEMSAPEVTDTAVRVIEESDPSAMVLNYANADMVGHTGDFDAAVAACEAVDAQLGRLVPALREAGAHVLVTADHGNADDMGTVEDPHTAHTFNPVPFVYLSPGGGDGGEGRGSGGDGESLAPGTWDGGFDVREGGELSDVAPTMLGLVGIEVPEIMTGTGLLE